MTVETYLPRTPYGYTPIVHAEPEWIMREFDIRGANLLPWQIEAKAIRDQYNNDFVVPLPA